MNKNVNRFDQKGQIILEYILLLIIGLMAASLIKTKLIGSGEDLDKMGFLRQKWIKIMLEIGKDQPN